MTDQEFHLRKLIEQLERENAALKEVAAAGRALVEYSHHGAANGWPDWESHFDALRAAIDAARKEQP